MSGVFAANDTPYLKIFFEGESAPTYLHASLVSGSYFAVLGIRPHMGRVLTEEDDQLPSASSDDRCAAVISYRLWVRRFGENPAALGRTLRVNDKTCAIVGIAPPHLRDAPDRLRPGRLASFTAAHRSEAARQPRYGVFLRRDGPAGAGCGDRAGRG